MVEVAVCLNKGIDVEHFRSNLALADWSGGRGRVPAARGEGGGAVAFPHRLTHVVCSSKLGHKGTPNESS